VCDLLLAVEREARVVGGLDAVVCRWRVERRFIGDATNSNLRAGRPGGRENRGKLCKV